MLVSDYSFVRAIYDYRNKTDDRHYNLPCTKLRVDSAVIDFKYSLLSLAYV